MPDPRPASPVPFVRAAILLAAAALVLAGLSVVPSDFAWDRLYWLGFAAAAYLAYAVANPAGALGGGAAVREAIEGRRRRGLARLASPWARGVALTVLLLAVMPELATRVGGYHRTLYYERQGDLLFAPVPNQTYMEKVSMTPSRTDALGLRGGPVEAGKRVILCLGDSIVYGYGLSDEETFPARLGVALRERSPEFAVANGGVNAYPMAFAWQRFLALWEAGLRPEAVIVGYSFNEGWLGHLVDADEETKRQFEGRVRLKNWLRSSGLYNVVMENWARSYYDAIKAQLVPGTHAAAGDPANDDDSYERTLSRFVDDLERRGVRPFFLVFSGFNGKNGRFDTDGPLHNRFAAFAESRGIPVRRSDEVLRRDLGPDADLWPYFLDYAHMNAVGADALARGLADWIAAELGPGKDAP